MIRYRPMKKARMLNDLADTVDIMDTEHMTIALETRLQRQNRQITWINRAPVKPLDPTDGMAEIVVNPQGDISNLIRFMGVMDETLIHAETYGSILRTAYSWDGCVSLTVIIEPNKLNKLITVLAIMPEVDVVEEKEKMSIEDMMSDTPRRFRGIPVADNSRPKRQIEVKLEEAVLAA
jgi:hypothetical protein